MHQRVGRGANGALSSSLAGGELRNLVALLAGLNTYTSSPLWGRGGSRILMRGGGIPFRKKEASFSELVREREGSWRREK
jgi:hypothetical protein